MDFKYFRGYSNVIRLYSRSVQVNGGERRIRATWTPEMAQDLNSFHHVDAEAALTAMLSRQITEEIDREILHSISMPMIRRVGFNRVAQEMVAVQPLSAPIGRLFYMDFKYDTYLPFDFKYGNENFILT